MMDVLFCTPTAVHVGTVDTTTTSHQDAQEAFLRARLEQFYRRCEGEGGGLTVAQRIRAFEKSKLGAGGKEVRLRGDGSKPRRKKPQSKAFEEFESTGVIIGFGKKPRPKTDPTCGSGDGAADDQYEPDREEEEEEEDSMGSLDYKASSLSKSQESDRSISISQASSTRLTEDEGIHTMDSEDDEFAAVARNSEVLKSFRRAPPPKNRTKARRSIRQRAHLKEEAEVNDFFRSMGLDEIDNEDGQSSPSILKKSKSQPVSLQSAKERRIQFDTQQSHPAAAIGRASPKQARDSPKPNKSSSNLKSSSNVLKTPSDSAVAPKDEAGPATTKKCDNSSSTNDSNTNKESGGGSNRLDSDTKDSQPTKQQPLNKHNVFLDWVPAWKDSSSSASKERAQVHRQWPPPRDGSHPARGSNPAIDALGLGLGRLGSRAEDVKPKGPWGGAAAPGHAKISSRVDFYNKEPCNQAERDAKLDRLRRPLSYHYSHEDSRKDSTGYESEASIHYSNDGGYNFYTRNPLQSATRSASEQQAGVAVAEPAASKPWQQELAASGRGGKRLTKQIEELSNFASSSDKQQPPRSAWYQVGDEDDCPAPPQRPPPRLPPARSNRHSYHPSSTGASSSSSPSSPYSPLLHHHHQATSPLIYPASSQHHHPPRPQLHHSQSYTQQSQSAADLHDDDAPHQSYRPVYTDRYGYGPLPTHDRYSYYSQSSHLSYDCDNELSPMSSSDSHSYGGYYGGGGGGSGLSPGGGDHSPSYQYPRVQSPRGSQYQGYNPLPSHDPSYSPGSPVTSSSHGGSVGHLSPADTSTAFSTTYSLTQRSREEIPLEYRGSTPRLDSRGSSDPHTPSSSSIEFHIEQDGTPV